MNMVVDGTVAIAGYSITKPIYASTLTLVYQANRNIDKMPVVIKLMRSEYPSFKEIVQFHNQYTITKNLDLPGIVKIYSLEAYRNGYALIMEDMGGISLQDWIMQKQGDIIHDFLSVAMQIATHLEAIHRHRVIHKDIKPSNILINPQTHQVKLIDFSVASLLSKETPQLQNPHILEGTLAYISPEQTGRMNRGIDYRSDFYALGVTFYELLTGRLPFSSVEPMELVHSHIAKIAPDVHTINPSIPLVISNIIAKLMAKNAEDRYQNAAGLKYDLELCLTQYQKTKNIVEFSLGSRDIDEHFLIPEQLYGRTSEVEILLQAFDRVSNGATEMLLVAGCSGIGKTAVINEVHKPIVRQRGHFIKGKYNQFQRDIPFLAFVQAFQDLISQILSDSDAQIQLWRSKILSALGDNGQVIIDVIPELENIIGKQPPVTELSGNSAQIRFNLLFQNFTQVFTTQAHPLVIFLDDLQWADLASLKLLEILMNDAGSLLVIGSYRDDEILHTHPLLLTLQEIKKNGSIVNTITLNNLSQSDINNLVADTLSCDEIVAQPLTELIYQKTQGNPFFATQFLKFLFDEKLITFDNNARYWQCDIAQVKVVAMIDNVVEFMAMQLQKLPPATQDVLKLAACIGTQFDLNTLAIAAARSPAATAVDLWKALQDGLLLPTSEIYKFFTDADDLPTSVTPSAVNPTYKFLHDRVHEAAYSLIPDDRKQSTHLRIGQLLLQHIPTSEQEARIFDIVNHLNRGVEVISTTAQRQELILLNFMAGKKARTATAYGAAVNYFAIAKSLLPANHWQRQYHLSLDIYHAAAEVAYLSGDILQMEQLIDVIFQNAESLLDTIKAYEIRLNSFTSNHQPTKSVAMGLEALKHLGVKFPQKPTKLQIILAWLPIKLALGRKSPQDVLALPPMQNPTALAKMSLLSSIVTASYMCEPNLYPLIILKQLELSISYGNSAFVAPGYTAYGFILCMMGDIETGYQFGELGLRLTETGLGKQFRTEVLFIFSNMIRIWKDPLAATLETSLQGYQTGLETGKLEYASYNAAGYCAALLHSGEQLDRVLAEFAKYSQSLQQLHQDKALTYHLIAQQLVLNLMGKSADPCCLVGEVYDEIAMQQKYLAAQEANSLSRLYTLKTWLGVLFGQEQQAVENARLAEKWIAGSQGTLLTSLFCFYQALAKLSIYPTASKSAQAKILQQVNQNLKQLRKWADYAPMTYLHKWCLVTAEKHRVLGKMSAAMEMYDRAIALAKENQFLHEEAIACELAAKFYLNWGKAKVAQVYMIDAYYAYSRWGAVAKLNDLEKRYPQLLPTIRQQSTNATSFPDFKKQAATLYNSATLLDLRTILKASQTLSSQMELEKLLTALLQILIENAGADKAVLLLPQSDQWLIAGVSQLQQHTTILQSLPLENSETVPISLINSVKNTRKSAVIDRAIDHPTFAVDPYILHHRPQSILCTPIFHQGKLIGILYLENNLTVGAFTGDRVELLNLLCAQVAISLENARLYQESQNYAQQLERSLQQLQQAQKELLHSTQALQSTQNQLQKLAENAPGMIYQFRLAVDGSASFSYVSSGCYELFGLHPEEITDADVLFGMTYPEERQSIKQSIIDSAANLTPWQWEGRFLVAGKEKWTQAASRPEMQADGAIVWDGVLIDISANKFAEAALRESEIQLRQKAEDLEKALYELQQTQTQLVQSEKMSALGNLVAGVAHEINNPIGFLGGNIDYALDYIKDLFGLIDLYQQEYSNSSTAIARQIKAIDLNYIRKDLPKMLASMQDAVNRICDISNSLRTFSRADSDRPITFNIHDGINSTLLILKHRLKASKSRPAIEVIKNYGEIPQIKCYPGQLNQVFMNLLVNAIDALEEANIGRSFAEIQAHPNYITITTSLTENLQQVIISIQDNGHGMTAEVKQKIFKQLFTTKPVGKGTGLGLAIARQIIVEKHGGTINVNSSPKKGAEFMISLPIESSSDDF
ncbi:multi-sensor signal transduction histidine kinase [Tolypothrix tenuis PCC 7101]|uniref:histidine kinase n=1 Tax=Tolypothrix tenuis PCC 7101 TaxID=231146 RepID=A0A1Z4MYZ7_9CYAN|nr:AAA family ATPase [Aulosira sp. FACHB-113]BAY98706.1 multi-sensor signal transduction histidine kinase [Tolypothrix tenuis PCC 7101]BAZ77377.1 multi-sensor signal transduction histidine kinase [Aulosira laxa NIES-50]